jgi:hypothetical protein
MSAGKFNLSDADGGTERKELDYDYERSDNVIVDLVDYTRSKTVQNEEQFMLTTLCYFTGFFESPKHFASYVLIGTAGSGKSHLQNTIEELMPDGYLYQATTGSEKSLIYDDTWEDAYFASLDEMNKPSDEIIEILKSLHGGEDEEFRYKVTGEGQGADREVEEIVRSAIPYGFLYAQYEPDFELWDRLIKIPVHESGPKNEGVAAMQWDHSMISFGDGETDYIYDFDDGRKALTDHIREMPKDMWVKIPAGEDEYGWDAFKHAKPIFDIDRSETNRVSSQVANLVRASALLNYENRDIRKIQVQNEGAKEAIIAEPQDVANVLACRDTLLATTHQLDRKRKAICLAIQQAGGPQQAATVQSIQDYLKKTDASFVKRGQVEAMLADLEDNYLVEKLERAGENGRHLYQFQSWQSLGKFDITDEFREVFGGTVNPFNGEPFVDTAMETNDELTPKASDFMNDDPISVESDSGSSEKSQATLGGGTTDVIEVDLEPYQKAVYKALKSNLDGETITGLDEHDPSPREMCGVVPMGDNPSTADVSGTIFDPEHDVWTYGPDEWVNSKTDADTQVSQAIRHLTGEGVLKTDVTKRRGSKPLEMSVEVKDIK